MADVIFLVNFLIEFLLGVLNYFTPIVVPNADSTKEGALLNECFSAAIMTVGATTLFVYLKASKLNPAAANVLRYCVGLGTSVYHVMLTYIITKRYFTGELICSQRATDPAWFRTGGFIGGVAVHGILAIGLLRAALAANK